MTRYRSGGRSSSTPCPGSMASIHRAIPSPRCARTSTCSAAAGGGRSSATGGVDQRPDPQLAFTKGTKLMSIASPPRALTTVGVVTHPRRNCDEVFTAIVGWVRARGARLIGLPEEAPAGVSHADQVPGEDFARTADLVIAAGGDGTILRALALAAPAGVPVLGVNLGRLGFLAEVDPPELGRALEAIGAGEYRVEERLALECTLHTHEGPMTVHAFNDLVVWRTPGFGQAALAVSVGGELFARHAADGIIVATPTGSTAYTLSVGGPIVSPVVDAILVTPLAPHGLFNRTLTIAATELLEIDVLGESAPVVVERDGARERELTPGATIAVRRSDAPGLLVRLGWTSFYGRARVREHEQARRLSPRERRRLVARLGTASRPGSQGHFHDPEQFLPARAARCPHGHSVHDRRDVSGEIASVSVGRKVVVRYRPLEAPPDRHLDRRAARGQLAPDRIGRRAARERALHQEASLRVPRTAQLLDGPAQQRLDDGARGRLLESLADVGCRPIVVAIERLAEQRFLVAERGIEARAVDAHGPGQIRERRALVTFAPEDLQRLVESFVHVEGARAPDRRRALAP